MGYATLHRSWMQNKTGRFCILCRMPTRVPPPLSAVNALSSGVNPCGGCDDDLLDQPVRTLPHRSSPCTNEPPGCAQLCRSHRGTSSQWGASGYMTTQQAGGAQVALLKTLASAWASIATTYRRMSLSFVTHRFGSGGESSRRSACGPARVRLASPLTLTLTLA